MKEQLLTFARRAWNDFRGFSSGQKAVTVFALLALVVGGIFLATWSPAPTYAPLYTNLATSDASSIVDKLNAQGTPYKLAAAGTEVLVPKDKVYETRIAISAAGLPSSSQTGYSLLDKEGVTTSEFKQQVDYQRAIEGELGKTIQAIGGVQSASVHLAIPQPNVFNDGSQKPSAAVMLGMAGATKLTTQQVQSIVYLVSSSVPNLAADDVTVTDASGALLAAPGQGLTGSAGTDTPTQAVQAYNTQRAAELQALLTPVVGAGHAVVTVNADLNFDKTSTTTKDYTYDPKNPPLSEKVTKESLTGAGGSGGTLGAGLPATAGAPAGGNSKYGNTSDTRDNALGTKTQTVEQAPGKVNKQAIGVVIDSSVKGANLTRINSLLRSAAGFDATRGDTLSIQAMPFDTSAAQAAAKSSAAASKAAAAKKAHEQLVSYVKQGLLALTLLAVVIGTWLASRRKRRVPEAPFDDHEYLEPLIVDPAPPAVAPPAPVEEIQEAAARRRALLNLAEEQPEDVASVLSGWLNSKDADNDRGPRNPWATSLSGPKGNPR